MVKIINELGAGGRIGAAFGAGFGDALGQLAQHKMQNMIKEKEYQQNAKLIKNLYPQLSDAEAYNFARAPEPLQKMLFERGISASGGQTQQQQAGISALPGQEVSVEEKLEPGKEVVKETVQEPRKLEFGLSPKEKALQLQEAKKKKDTVETAYKGAEYSGDIIDKSLNLLKKARKEVGSGLFSSKPGSTSKYLYKGDVDAATSNPIIQELGSLYQALANKDTIKMLKESGSKAGVAFANAIEKAKVNVFQDYDAQEAILERLKDDLKPLLKEGRVLKDILKKNNDTVPLDLEQRMAKALGSEVYEEAKPQDQEAQDANSLPEGATVVQNGVSFKKVNNQWVPVG